MITIDMNYWVDSEKLKARKVWQHLFDFYRNNDGDLNDMDNMQCDFLDLIKLFEDGKAFTLYFMFVGCSTHLNECPDFSYGPNLKIEWDGGKIVTIEKVSVILPSRS